MTRPPRCAAGAVYISLLESCGEDALIGRMAENGVRVLGMERMPRISRAQSMDALSSQSNIAGYRAVIEAAAHYGRFFPMMMTSAGSAKPTRLVVLGAGVAGLQAIATARRLGADVYAYDVRPETKEQIESSAPRPSSWTWARAAPARAAMPRSCPTRPRPGSRRCWRMSWPRPM
jgi:NAD(P) transhydrogenase subunit alpha